MNSKIVALFALFALIGCAFSAQQTTSTIQLSIASGSSGWWIAVDPTGEAETTTEVELLESSSEEWVQMIYSSDWSYYQLASVSGKQFDLPLSFRLTASNGEQVILDNVVTSIVGGSTVNTAAQFSTSALQIPVSSTPSQAPTAAASHTSAPTQKATSAPTQKATSAPTQKATQAPTHAATSAPTQKATAAPTQKATHAPTAAPTQKATSAPTQKATQAATHAPTAAPTQKATHAPIVTSAPASSGSSSSSSLCTVTPTSSEPIKLLVPLYTDPGSSWDDVIAAAATGVQIIAIINPNSGPVASGPDSSYTTYIARLIAAGVEVVGYVHTSYGARAIADVEADVNTYATKYAGLVGIFVDETATTASELTYYASVYAYIMSRPNYIHTIVNPGEVPDAGYINVATNIVVFEDSSSKLKSSLFPSWITCAPSADQQAGYKYKFSAIAYGAAQSGMSALLTTMQNSNIGLVYVTDGLSGCCTYNTLVSFMTEEVNALVAMN